MNVKDFPGYLTRPERMVSDERVAELNAILNSEDDRPISINPDGSVTVAESEALMSEALAEDIANMAVDDNAEFASEAEAAAWQEQERRAKQRYHEDRAKAAHAATATTAVRTDIATLDKNIADDITEEANLLAIMSNAAARHRQVKTSRRAKEDMRDSMAAS